MLLLHLILLMYATHRQSSPSTNEIALHHFISYFHQATRSRSVTRSPRVKLRSSYTSIVVQVYLDRDKGYKITECSAWERNPQIRPTPVDVRPCICQKRLYCSGEVDAETLQQAFDCKPHRWTIEKTAYSSYPCRAVSLFARPALYLHVLALFSDEAIGRRKV